MPITSFPLSCTHRLDKDGNNRARKIRYSGHYQALDTPYTLTVQTDEATFGRRCVTQGFAAHNMAEFERGKRIFPRGGYFQQCVS